MKIPQPHWRLYSKIILDTKLTSAVWLEEQMYKEERQQAKVVVATQILSCKVNVTIINFREKWQNVTTVPILQQP